MNDFSPLERDFIANRDIEKIYELVDLLSVKGNQEDKISYLYNFMFDEVMNLAGEFISNGQYLSYLVKKESYYLRVLYENALNFYLDGKLKRAEELFLLLSKISLDEVFVFSMKLHMLCVLKGLNFSKFLDTFVKITNEEEFFILDFNDCAKEYFDENKKILEGFV